MMRKAAIVVFLAAVGAAPMAFAREGYGGPGYGGHMMGGYGYGGNMMGPGYGGHMMGYGGPMGWQGDREDRGLSQEQAEQLEKARESFYRANRGLQDEIYDKSAQIRSEFSRQNPDRGRLNELQKQLSQLESQFDQKRLDYLLEIRKIAPEVGEQFAGGYGPGAGGCWR
jgi:zinc resistance-associated protein